MAASVNFFKTNASNVKEKFQEEYDRLMDDYETKRKQSQDLYNTFYNYKQQKVDIRLLKNDVAQLKNQLHYSISLITPCFITSSLYIQHYFTVPPIKDQVYKYQNEILECQFYYIEMINKISECEREINKELGLDDKPVNVNHEDKKAKIDRVMNMIHPKPQPPPPSSSSNKKEIKDLTPDNPMQSIKDIYIFIYI